MKDSSSGKGSSKRDSFLRPCSTGHFYRVGYAYNDRGNPYLEDDEFSRWLVAKGRTIGMVGGVRSRSYTGTIGTDLPAYVVLLTTHISADYTNPWDDMIDEHAGIIRYWGDAKFSARNKLCEDFIGNRCMKRIYDEILIGDLSLIPPILHFTRPSTGKVRFNGLCVLEGAELTWFEDAGRPIRNYRYGLSILDEELVSIYWLRSRVTASSRQDLVDGAPSAWVDYVRGRRIRKRQVWRKQIRTTTSQLPRPGSEDERVLKQLVNLGPKKFEAVIVALFREIKAVEHTITQTRYVNDKGFDFYGTFTMPVPVGYEVRFRGEVKRYALGRRVGPDEVSRLVARLRRGEYGIFVTTSYYSPQAQEEVLEDAYPVKLFSGADLVRFLRELKLICGTQINQDWIDTVTTEL